MNETGSDEGAPREDGTLTNGAIADVTLTDTALALEGVTKRFGRLTALDNASLVVRRGTVHALLGENGAGKTTLVRIAFGLLSPDQGVVRVDGRERRFRSPSDAIAAGIGMVHQHFMLVPAMTVAENVALGMRGRYDLVRIRDVVRTVGRRTGLSVDPDALVATLSVEAQQRVEILKALIRDATTLILDEPTAVLAPAEARVLLQTMRVFVERGGSVVLITHKLRDALEFADDVTVLRRGRTVLRTRDGLLAADPLAMVAPVELSLDMHRLDEQTLAAAMIGLPEGERSTGEESVVVCEGAVHELLKAEAALREAASHVAPPDTRECTFELRDVIVRDTNGVERLRGVTLTARAREILGVVAVEGNGQHELLRVLANRLLATSGIVETPKQVGFIPEDRQRDALILDFTLSENVALFGAGQRRGRVPWRRLYDATMMLMVRYDVRARGPGARARTLSGGNQQKLVVGRELEGAPRALVAENPTRGLDVQAMAAVHQRLREARDGGAAVVFYSSDLDEVLQVADRIVVVFDGTVRRVPLDREQVGRAMLGEDRGSA